MKYVTHVSIKEEEGLRRSKEGAHPLSEEGRVMGTDTGLLVD